MYSVSVTAGDLAKINQVLWIVISGSIKGYCDCPTWPTALVNPVYPPNWELSPMTPC